MLLLLLFFGHITPFVLCGDSNQHSKVFCVLEGARLDKVKEISHARAALLTEHCVGFPCLRPLHNFFVCVCVAPERVFKGNKASWGGGTAITWTKNGRASRRIGL